MKIFKFTQGGEAFPEIYYLSAGLRFSAAMAYEIFIKGLCYENIGLRAIKGERHFMSASDELGMHDQFAEIFQFIESMGLNAEEFRVGWGYFTEQLRLAANMNNRKTISISLTEGMALADSGTESLGIVSYTLTWRARTRNNQTGYAGTGYGNVSGYGDGTASDLLEFVVKVYRLSDNTLRRTVTIPITDQANPDNVASFEYTWQMNLSDNNWQYQTSLRFEVYQRNTAGVLSPAASIDITPNPLL